MTRPSVLYKYVRPDGIRLLTDRRLKVTPPNQFNDPFEVLPNISALMPPDQLDAFFLQHLQESKEEIYDETARKLGIPIDALSGILSFENFKDLVRTEDLSALTSPILSEIAQSITNAANDLLGIICLTEVRDSLLMWGHYTDAHKGLIFGFNPTHHFFDQRVREDDVIRSLRKVSYSKHRPRVTLYDSTLGDAELADSFANQFFLTKFQDWSYEQEWRMILPLEQSSLVDGAHLLALPEGCLTEVVLGSRISDTDRETIETCLDADGFWANVTLSEASIDKEEFRINIDGRVH